MTPEPGHRAPHAAESSTVPSGSGSDDVPYDTSYMNSPELTSDVCELRPAQDGTFTGHSISLLVLYERR